MVAMPQALFVSGVQRAASPGFTSDLTDSVTKLVAHLQSSANNDALFALPITNEYTGVIRTRGNQAYVLAVPVAFYRAIGDPFTIGRHFPEDYLATEPLADL